MTFTKRRFLETQSEQDGNTGRQPVCGRGDSNPVRLLLLVTPRTAGARDPAAHLTCRRSACGGTWVAPPCSAGPPRCAPPGSRRSTAEGLSAPGRAAPPAPASHRSCPARRGSSRPQPPASCRPEVGSAARNPREQSKSRPKSKDRADCSAPANINRDAASLTLLQHNTSGSQISRGRDWEGSVNPKIPESLQMDPGFACLRGFLVLTA